MARVFREGHYGIITWVHENVGLYQYYNLRSREEIGPRASGCTLDGDANMYEELI